MGRSRSLVGLIVAALLPAGFIQPAIGQDKLPIIALPSSPWRLNYADDSCRLARTFKADGKDLGFSIDAFEPGPGFTLTTASTFFSGYANRQVTMKFGPGGAENTVEHNIGATIDRFGAAVINDNSRLIDTPPLPKDNQADSLEVAPSALVDIEALPTATQEKAVEYLDVIQGTKRPVRFALGPMDQPMKALRACTDELMTHWGIDVEAHRTLSRRARPTGDPRKWVSNDDYPTALIRQGGQGLIKFRLSVDETGKVADCSIQKSSRPEVFDRTVCEVMTQHARFEPALDAAGRPIKSYWRSTLRFVLQ